MINMIRFTRAHAVEEEEVARLEILLQPPWRKAARSFDFVAGTFGGDRLGHSHALQPRRLTTAAI